MTIDDFKNKIILGDNLDVLRQIPSNTIDLIYTDPPFNTGGTCTTEKASFKDKYNSQNHFIEFLRDRIVECKRVLKKNGSFYLHIGPRNSHYVKIMLDEVFGIGNFKREIIVNSTPISIQQTRSNFMEDTERIFFYINGGKHTFNMIYVPYKTKNLKDSYKFDDNDGRGLYAINTCYFNHSEQTMKKFQDDGVIVGWTRTGRCFLKKVYLKDKHMKGNPLGNVWMNTKRKKSTANMYPTEKPLDLLERIILVSSNEGDLVLDPFNGGGTTCVAAKSLGRNYIGIDISKDSIDYTNRRLQQTLLKI